MENNSVVTFKVSIADMDFEIRHTLDNRFFWKTVNAWVDIENESPSFNSERVCLIRKTRIGFHSMKRRFSMTLRR